MNPSLDQLESRVHALVEKINKLRSDNHRLHDELALSRQDFASQSKELEKERQKSAATPESSSKQDEWCKALEHQTQEIQLLEKERLNLRDQIAFLQNTIQNKEKDWKDKSQQVREQLDQQLQEKQQQLAQSLERISNLELKLQLLQTDTEQAASLIDEQKNRAQDFEAELNKKTQQARFLEQQLANTKTNLQEQQKNHQNQINELNQAHEAALIQETERFRIEYALLNKQHEQNLSDLTQALTQQKERLREENQAMQEKLQQITEQNQAYRSLLTQNAANIRALLSRLPQPQNTKETHHEH